MRHAASRAGRARLPRRPGSATLVVVLLLALAGMLTAAFARDLESRRLHLAQRQREQLAQARDRTLAWIASHLGEFDAQFQGPGATPDPSLLLAQAGIDPRTGLQLAIGPVQSASAMPYVPLVVWLPAAPGDHAQWGADGTATTFDPSRALVFSTRALEQDAWALSLARLQLLAQRAESRFATKVESDPDHRIDRNWFRDPDGICREGADQIPCAGVLATSAWPTVQALTAGSMAFEDPAVADGRLDRNAWGGDNLWTNDADPALDRSPPFAMVFGTRSPWSQWLSVRAVQPM